MTAKSIKTPNSDKEQKSVLSHLSVDTAKSIKAPKSVVSQLSVDPATSIKAPKTDNALKYCISAVR